mgnify:CR=1 FL=1
MADVLFLSPQKNQCILTTHTEALSRAARQTGVVNGNRVTPTDPASMTVTVEAGRIKIAGAPSNVTLADVALSAAHGTLPRMDIIYRDTSGIPQVATGIPDAIEDPKALGDWKSYTAPTPPSTIPDGVILAAVYIPAAAASISAGYIWMFAGGVGDISTSVATPGSDSYPPSEQAVRELAETKISSSDIVTFVDNPGSDAKVPSEQAVRKLAGTLAPAAKGVTNGDTHDHSGGDGNIALDKIQKGKSITDEEFKSLKKKKLIEGRRSNLFVSAKVAVATDTKVDYIKRRGIDNEYSKKLVLDYLGKFKEATRQEINQLLMDKLSDSLSEDQKKSHIKNLLQEMRTEGSIKALRTGRISVWFSSKSASQILKLDE